MPTKSLLSHTLRRESSVLSIVVLLCCLKKCGGKLIFTAECCPKNAAANGNIVNPRSDKMCFVEF